MIYLEHNDEKCDRLGLRYILRLDCASDVPSGSNVTIEKAGQPPDGER